jgi:hypothetical protein
MATTQLAAGATTANSSNIIVTTSPVSVGLFRDAGELSDKAKAKVLMVTPGADLLIGTLNENNPVVVLTGPGTYKVARASNSDAENYGVFSEP